MSIIMVAKITAKRGESIRQSKTQVMPQTKSAEVRQRRHADATMNSRKVEKFRNRIHRSFFSGNNRRNANSVRNRSGIIRTIGKASSRVSPQFLNTDNTHEKNSSGFGCHPDRSLRFGAEG
ncbi:MAG: hypothetical protein WBQ69_06160 [Gallionella sp.]